MAQNTSVALGDYFEKFVRTIISEGRYKNASEVIRAGLRLLEKEENKINALKKAIQEGLDSPVVEDFDFEKHLAELKTRAIKND
jgi:antitoxin ParD1/3/4